VSAKARRADFDYFKHALLTQVIKIVPGHAFFDTLSLKCPENAPFSVQFKIILATTNPSAVHFI
jgi:hypothetical protein